MRLDLDNPPQDTAVLHRSVRDITGLVEHRDSEITRLQQIIKQLQRAQYGRRSERLDPGQLALALEELDTDIAQIIESKPAPPVAERARRMPLPDHLVRKEVLLDIETDSCTRCGGTLHEIGESVSEMLDWVPATLRVIRIRRPKYACRQCETVAQVLAPHRVTPVALKSDPSRSPGPATPRVPFTGGWAGGAGWVKSRWQGPLVLSPAGMRRQPLLRTS